MFRLLFSLTVLSFEGNKDIACFGELKYELYRNKTASLIGFCTKKVKFQVLNIPNFIIHSGENYTIKVIKNCSSFYGDVLLPDSLVSIEKNAFNSKPIASISFGNSIEKIGEGAFQDCIFLACDIMLPDSIKIIEKNAFRGSAIKSIKLGSYLEELKESAFYSCSQLERIIINKNHGERQFGKITRISSNAFYNCMRLTGTIFVDDFITSIDQYAFCGTSIERIVFGEYLQTINDHAFSNCKKLQANIIFPYSLKTIGSHAFSYSSITGAVFNEKINCIEEYAFYKCKSLSGSINYPQSFNETQEGVFAFTNISFINLSNIRKLGNRTFECCMNLEIELNTSQMTFIGEYAFFNCSKVTGDIYLNISTINPYAFAGTNISSIEFNSSTYFIGEGAFMQCKGLNRNITLPYYLREIGKNAFMESSVRIINSYNQIKTIGDFAFCNCKNLSNEFFIPESVEILGESSFENTSICFITYKHYSNYGSKVLLKIIGKRAFYCSALNSSFYLPSTITEIGDYAFYSTNIKEISDSRSDCTIKRIGKGAFMNCYKLSYFLNFRKVECVCQYAFTGVHIDHINSNNFIYNEKAFFNCSIYDLFISANRYDNTIGKDCFAYTTISKLTIYDVSCIGERAFFNAKICSPLFLRDYLNYIGSYAFAFCNLSEINIPWHKDLVLCPNCFESSTLKRIGRIVTKRIPDYFCFNCKELEGDVVIDKVVCEIGNCAFQYTAINSLTIASDCISIKPFAFSKCIHLSGKFPCFTKYELIGNNAFEYTAFDSPLIIEADEIQSDAFLNCKNIYGNIEIRCKNIGERAFSGCSRIESASLYNSQNISNGLFMFCKSLVSVDIHPFNDKREFIIGSNSFALCTNLKTISWLNEIAVINDSAFYCCESLRGIIPFERMRNLTYIGEKAFEGCCSLSGRLTLPNSLAYIGENAFIESRFTDSLSIPDNVEIISNYAFFKCECFTGNLIIGKRCRVIGNSAFSMCRGFTGRLIIGANVRIIGICAFSMDSSFTGTLELPSNIEIIRDSAFYYCRGLTGKLVLPKSLATIGRDSFSHCSGFELIEVHNSLRNVDLSSLQDVNNITYVQEQITENDNNNQQHQRECEVINESRSSIRIFSSSIDCFLSSVFLVVVSFLFVRILYFIFSL